MAIAFVCITTEPASIEEVLKALKAVKGVKEAKMVYDIYHIVAKVKVYSVSSLKKILTEHIRKINKILSTITLMVVEAQ